MSVSNSLQVGLISSVVFTARTRSETTCRLLRQLSGKHDELYVIERQRYAEEDMIQTNWRVKSRGMTFWKMQFQYPDEPSVTRGNFMPPKSTCWRYQLS